MKKIVLIAAAAGLMTLAACNKPADTAMTNNEADMVATMDNTADNLSDMAAATSNDAASNALDNAADSVKAASDNVTAAATNGQ